MSSTHNSEALSGINNCLPINKLMFWGNKKEISNDFKYDLHSHLLPNVDDGVSSLEESLQCINSLIELGYSAAITTPHVFAEVFDNDEKALIGKFQDLKKEIKKYFPDFEIALGAEYFLDENLLRKIERNQPLLTFGKAELPWLLVEFTSVLEPQILDDFFTFCRKSKIQPIIAHAERYSYIQADDGLGKIISWKRAGALMQLDMGSIIGQYGAAASKTATKMLQGNLIDLIGTDLHRPRQISRYIKPGLKEILGKYNKCFNRTKQHLLF